MLLKKKKKKSTKTPFFHQEIIKSLKYQDLSDSVQRAEEQIRLV